MNMSERFKLSSISMLIIAGLAVFSTQASAATAPQGVTKNLDVFRLFDNPKGYKVYIKVEGITHFQDGSNSSMGVVMFNFDSPQRLNHKSYKSEWMMLWAKCDDNNKLIQFAKTWAKAGLSMSGETIAIGDKSEVRKTRPGSEEEMIRTALCLPDPVLIDHLDKVQKMMPGYPPIVIDFSVLH